MKGLGLCWFLGWLPSLAVMATLGGSCPLPLGLIVVLVGGAYFFGWAIMTGTLDLLFGGFVSTLFGSAK